MELTMMARFYKALCPGLLAVVCIQRGDVRAAGVPEDVAPGPSDQTVVSSDPPCSPCDEVVRRVLAILPKPPVRIVVIDTARSPALLKDKLMDVEGFVTAGDRTVCLTKQGSTFTHALNGPGIWDFALAIIVWHEMAHLEGAAEREAQAKEEALWLDFVRNGKVDTNRGLAYLRLLRKRSAH
jgi:hypothetical protein